MTPSLDIHIGCRVRGVTVLGMKPALNGLLGGLPFRGRLLMPTRAWTLTSISLATRRRKSPFPLTILECQTPRLRPAPLLRLLLPLLTSELLRISLLVCLFVFSFTLGSEPEIYVTSFSMNTSFSTSSLLPFFFFLYKCVPRVALPELNS